MRATSQISASVTQAVAEVDADVPLYQERTLESIASDRVAERRLAAILISIFGALALAMAAVGIYGVMSFSVSQRSHELGIRMALGAQRRDILRMVMRSGMALALVGLGIGLAAAYFGMAPLVSSLARWKLWLMTRHCLVTTAQCSAFTSYELAEKVRQSGA